MIEEIPKVSDTQVSSQNKDMRLRITQGTITQWLDEQLRSLAESNPILYKYIMEHSQKFAMGAVMVQDPQSIAMSLALEQILLLNLLGASYKTNKDLKGFSELMNGWWGENDIKGLDDFDKK